ncbi:hypothetical protein CHU98_g3939 [Xylaria longipes]|nr:hypothetical protein CHU98_g3939 [Xylaria longipes]
MHAIDRFVPRYVCDAVLASVRSPTSPFAPGYRTVHLQVEATVLTYIMHACSNVTLRPNLPPCSLARRDLPTNENAAALRNASCHILVRRPYSAASRGTGTAPQYGTVLGPTRLVPRGGPVPRMDLIGSQPIEQWGATAGQASRMQHPGTQLAYAPSTLLR